MNAIATEILVLAVLILINGVLAMTEIAVVSARKMRLKQFAREGRAAAQAALDLAENPTRFLSTVQVGITLVGVFAGAFGGATLAEEIGAVLDRLPGMHGYGEAAGLGIVVLLISYGSLVLGELVPKRLGLGRPERVAMLMAGPMRRLARLASPVVTLLTFSTEMFLRLLRVKPETQVTVSEEEVRVLMQEGLRAGAFNKVESEIVSRVLDLDQLAVREIMTPRAKVIWLKREDSHEKIWHKIVVSNHSQFPVYGENRDQVLGIVSVKAIYAHLAASIPINLPDLVVRPLIVPATQRVIQLLETFKQSGKHLALVTDEFGSMVGLVSLHDVMEAILGDFPSQDEKMQPAAKRREDGSWLVDALIEIDALERILPDISFGEEQGREFQTLAGFVVQNFGRVPKEGETFEWQGYVFEVLDMDRHRVDKVLVIPPAQNPPSR